MKRSDALCLFLACLTGAALFFLRGFQPDHLSVHNIAWLLDGDLAQGAVAASHYLQQGTWSRPFDIPTFAVPEPVGLARADAIPWFAVIFRALQGQQTEPAQHLGAWFLLCHVLQVASAWLLTRRLLPGTSPAVVLLTSLFTALAPVFLYRTGHAALCAQGLILMAMWAVSFKLCRWNLVVFQVVLLMALHSPTRKRPGPSAMTRCSHFRKERSTRPLYTS